MSIEVQGSARSAVELEQAGFTKEQGHAVLACIQRELKGMATSADLQSVEAVSGASVARLSATTEVISRTVSAIQDGMATAADLRVAEAGVKEEIAGVRGAVERLDGTLDGVRNEAKMLRWGLGVTLGLVLVMFIETVKSWVG